MCFKTTNRKLRSHRACEQLVSQCWLCRSRMQRGEWGNRIQRLCGRRPSQLQHSQCQSKSTKAKAFHGIARRDVISLSASPCASAKQGFLPRFFLSNCGLEWLPEVGSGKSRHGPWHLQREQEISLLLSRTQDSSYSKPSARKNLCPRLHQENVDVLLHHRIYLLGGLNPWTMKEYHGHLGSSSQIMGNILWKNNEKHMGKTMETSEKINKAKSINQLQIQRSLRAPEVWSSPEEHGLIHQDPATRCCIGRDPRLHFLALQEISSWIVRIHQTNDWCLLRIACFFPPRIAACTLVLPVLHFSGWIEAKFTLWSSTSQQINEFTCSISKDQLLFCLFSLRPEEVCHQPLQVLILPLWIMFHRRRTHHLLSHPALLRALRALQQILHRRQSWGHRAQGICGDAEGRRPSAPLCGCHPLHASPNHDRNETQQCRGIEGKRQGHGPGLF